MKIYGIGTDIVDVERIKNAVDKNIRFLNRNFTDKELEIFDLENLQYGRIAGNFALKEALSKALGTGIRKFNLKDIEVLRNPLGKPIINVYNELYELLENLGITEIMATMSHEKKYAVGTIILTIGGDEFESKRDNDKRGNYGKKRFQSRRCCKDSSRKSNRRTSRNR